MPFTPPSPDTLVNDSTFTPPPPDSVVEGSIPLDPLSNTKIQAQGLPPITLNPYDVAKQEGILSGRDASHPEEVIPSLTALTQPFVSIPKIHAESTLGKIAAAPVNVASGLLEGLESPVGLATLPLFGSAAGRAAMGALGTVQGFNQMRKAKDAGEFTEGALLAGLSPFLARTGEKTLGEIPRETPQFPTITKLPEPEVTPPTEPTPEVPQTPPVQEKSYAQRFADEVQAHREAENAAFLKEQSGEVSKPKTTLPQLIKTLGRQKVEELVGEWEDDAQLHPDGKSIIVYSDPRNRTGKMRGSTKQFLSWVERQTPPAETGEVQPQAVTPSAPEAGKAETPVAAGAEPATPTVTQPVPETTAQPATMTGAAHVSEIPEISQTGLKNAVGDLERVGLGLQDAPETVTRNMAGAWEQAGQIEREKPGTGANLAAMLSRDPDLGLTDTESALLLRHKVDLWNRLNDAAERTHTGDAASKARAQVEHDALSAQFGNLLDAVRLRGREWGREGRWRQAMAQDDFTFRSVDELNAFRRADTGKDLTEEQTPKAERIANENKTAQDELANATEKLSEDIRKKKVTDPETAKVWELARKYLEENKGFYGFDDLRNKIATDLGMKPEDVTKVLAQDKTTRKLADDVWTKQRNARRLKEQAKQWVKGLDTPGYIKALSSIPRAMFSLSVFGHGFVALGTHAPIVAFQPRFWNAYVRNFGKMYKMVFSPGYYEAQMQDLVRRPNYEKFRRAGLQNDPFKYEEFHTTLVRDLVKSWLGERNMQRVDNAASAGNRGYAVLKVLRQDMADQKYSKLPDSVRTEPGVVEALSDDINHATGVTRKQAPRGSNILLFAPRLAGSRVMWLGGDPIRAVRAVADWKNAPEAEKQFAVNQMREKAWVFGTFASLLAANQGFLTASGSKQKINGIPESLGGDGFDPLSSDFMKFKAAGGDIAYGGALLTMAKLPVRIATAILYEGKGSKYILEDERVDKVIGAYIRSQMSPFAGTATDLALGRDYQERPLPTKLFGLAEQNAAVPKRLQEQGVDEPYNWAEFTATKLPIPLAEAIKEGLRGSGMSEDQVNSWYKAFAIGSLMTATGTRITEDTRDEQSYPFTY